MAGQSAVTSVQCRVDQNYSVDPAFYSKAPAPEDMMCVNPDSEATTTAKLKAVIKERPLSGNDILSGIGKFAFNILTFGATGCAPAPEEEPEYTPPPPHVILDKHGEPNDDFSTARQMQCDKVINATINGEDDVDVYDVFGFTPSRLKIKNLQSDYLELSVSFYDKDQNLISDEDTWIRGSAYLVITRKKSSSNYYNRPNDYSFSVECDPCDYVAEASQKCENGELWAYNECGDKLRQLQAPVKGLQCHNGDVYEVDQCDKPLVIKDDCTSSESCVNDKCCTDKYTYGCDFEAGLWMVTYYNGCHMSYPEALRTCIRGQYCEPGRDSSTPGQCKDY